MFTHLELDELFCMTSSLIKFFQKDLNLVLWTTKHLDLLLREVLYLEISYGHFSNINILHETGLIQ